MRATLLMLELASGSEVPRPTTISSVSSRGTGRLETRSACSMRARATWSKRTSTSRSRPYSMRTCGYWAVYSLRTEGMSFFTWPAAKSMPGTARMRSTPWPRSVSRPSRMIGRANSRKPLATGYCGSRRAMPAATAANSAIASSSRLPWPHTITPILVISYALTNGRAC
jgi:hypothetical protein